MERTIKSIWISSEEHGPILGGTAIVDDNTDVIVTFNDGSVYVATFFTYANVENLRRKNAETRECLSGKYFWASDMILIDRVDRGSIEQVIADLLREDSFDTVFSKSASRNDEADASLEA
jgi:hypothetical protein